MKTNELVKKKKQQITIVDVIIYLGLVILALIYVLPLLWMLSVSFKTNREVLTNPFSIPRVLQLGNYIFSWVNGKLGIATLNSVIVCAAALIISLLIGSMAAFAIARMRLKIMRYLMQYFLIGMMVPVHCVLIPLFVRFSSWNLTNQLIGLIIPYITFSLPITIFLMVGFFKSMPNELLEAACIDGCSIYGCFIRICLPLARVGMFVAGLMTFIGNWNELLLAMVFISDNLKKTLPVTLTFFVGPYATNYVQMFAAIIIAIAPTVVVYSIFSNQIVDGLTTGAVKG